MTSEVTQAVRGELDRILSSPGFTATPRMASFLRLVVGRALDGRHESIKEYVIGVEVYQRGPDFDPKLDSIVRVEAYRLRARLREFYSSPGPHPSVRIELPKGSYVPIFHFVESGVPVPALPSPRSSRRRWLGIGIAGAATVAIGAYALRRSPAGPRATLSVFAADQSAPVTAFQVQLAHRLGLALPSAHLATAGQFTELRPVDGEAVPASYGMILCGASDGGISFAAEAGATAAEITTFARLADTSEAESQACAASLATGFADALHAAEGIERETDSSLRSQYIEVLQHFRKGRDSLLLTNEEVRTGWPLNEILTGIARLDDLIRREPRFAAAHAQQAWLYSLAANYDPKLFVRAAQSARQALQLNDGLWKAHFNLGYVQFFHQWQFGDAARSFEQCRRLAPLRLETLRYYADSLAIAGRPGDARTTLHHLLAAAPTHRLVRATATALAYHLNEFSRMNQLATRSLDLSPSDPVALWQRALALEQLGQPAAAMRDLRLILARQPSDRRAASALVHLLARSGNKSQARLTADQSGIFASPYLSALFHAGAGDLRQCHAKLAASLEAREPGAVYFAIDPRFAALRASQSGHQLLASLRLSPSS
jgi:tetratricopeptide (TPR) repeat protein